MQKMFSLLKDGGVFTGAVCLTFFGQWSEVQSEINSKAIEQMYCAPGIVALHV